MKRNTILILILISSLHVFAETKYNLTNNGLASSTSSNKDDSDFGLIKSLGLLFGVQAGYSYSYQNSSITFDPELFTNLEYTFKQNAFDLNIATPIINIKKRWTLDKFSNDELSSDYRFTEINFWGIMKLTNYLMSKNHKDYLFLNMLTILSPTFQTSNIKNEDYQLEVHKTGFLFNLFTYKKQWEKFNDKELKLVNSKGQYGIINSDFEIDRITYGLNMMDFFRTVVDLYAYQITNNILPAKQMSQYKTLLPYPAVNYYVDKSTYRYGPENNKLELELKGVNYEIGVGWSPAFYFPRKDPKVIVLSNFSYYPIGGTNHTITSGSNTWEVNVLRKTKALSCKVSLLINI